MRSYWVYMGSCILNQTFHMWFKCLICASLSQPIGQGGTSSNNLRYQAYEMRKQNMSTSARDQTNSSATAELKQLMNQQGNKKGDDSDEEPPDDVR